MNTCEIASAKRVVDENFEYFKSRLPELKTAHSNEFTLLHEQTIVDFFESENDAIKEGMKNYGEGKFSVQKVADDHIDLGYQSYVII